MKPNFKNIDIYAGFQPQNGMEWQKENGITADWKTPEHINVDPEELAEVYRMLVENSYFNGEVIVVDGGYSYK